MSNDVELNMELIPINYEYDRKEYDTYKKLIKSHISRRKNENELPKFVKRHDNGDPSDFENILISNDDKSAVISLIVRELKLWSIRNFWKHVDLARVIKHYAKDENANIKNLFSILMFDWHNLVEEENKSYLLMLKFHKFDKNSKIKFFEKLCKIANEFKYFGCVCRSVIDEYIFLLKRENEYDNSLLSEYIDVALTIERRDLRTKILLSLMQILEKKNEDDDDEGNNDQTSEDGNKSDESEEEEEDAVTYEEVKQKIIEALKYEVKFDSIYKKSLKDINCFYAQAYTELYFLLVEHDIENFKKKFEEFLCMARNFYGDHWHMYTKNEINLLLNVTYTAVELTGIENFIRTKCDFSDEIEIHSDKIVIFNEPLNNKQIKALNKMYKLLQEFNEKDEKSKKKFLKHLDNLDSELLLGRRSLEDMSILEQITMDSKFNSILQSLWIDFYLWEDLPVLVDGNHPMKRTIVDFLLDSGSDEQIFAFLSIPGSEESGNHIMKKDKHFMMFFSAQMCAHENYQMCFIEYCIDLILRKKYDLVEKSRRYLMYYLEEVGYVRILSIDSVIEKLLNALNDTELNSQQLCEIDRILRSIIIYWKNEGNFYTKYRTRIINKMHSHELLFYMIEAKYDQFFRFYESKMKDLPKFYLYRFNCDTNSDEELDDDVPIESLNFDILCLAMKKNQTKVIDFILKRYKFDDIKIYLPENIEAQEIHYHTALKLMQARNQIIVENFPEEWFTVDVLKDFFNSRINVFNQVYIEMDLSFMIDEEIKSLEYLNDKGSLLGKEIILHPTIETYVNLRSYKYNRIYQINYLAFMFIFLFPFIPLIFSNEYRKIDKSYRAPYGLEYLHYISIGYLIIRETFQFIIEENKLDYFKETSNRNELFLITTTITLSICSSFFYEKYSIMVLEILFILMSTISATTLNFLTKDPVYIKILKKITVIFLKIMHVFIVILFGLAFCVYIVLDESEKTPDKDSSFEDYVNSPVSSFLKVLTMLSGEFSLDLQNMNFFKLAFSLLFVITSFILFNLILGISFENIGNIMTETRQLNVLDKTKKLLHMEKRFEAFKHWMSSHRRTCFGFIVDFFLRQYEYIHDLEKIYISISDKHVYVRDDRDRQGVLKFSNSQRGKNYEMDDETFEEIQKIIKMKEEKKEKQKEEKIKETNILI